MTVFLVEASNCSLMIISALFISISTHIYARCSIPSIFLLFPIILLMRWNCWFFTLKPFVYNVAISDLRLIVCRTIIAYDLFPSIVLNRFFGFFFVQRHRVLLLLFVLSTDHDASIRTEDATYELSVTNVRESSNMCVHILYKFCFLFQAFRTYKSRYDALCISILCYGRKKGTVNTRSQQFDTCLSWCIHEWKEVREKMPKTQTEETKNIQSKAYVSPNCSGKKHSRSKMTTKTTSERNIMLVFVQMLTYVACTRAPHIVFVASRTHFDLAMLLALA